MTGLPLPPGQFCDNPGHARLPVTLFLMSLPLPLLQARELACSRGDAALFGGLRFELKAGEALQIEGANGSGKTSLLRILAGLTPPDEGEVRWRGRDIAGHRQFFQAELGYLGHHLGLKSELTATENLALGLGVHGIARAEPDLEPALSRVGLGHRADLPVRSLSAGQRQRVALARLLLQKAVLWVLDEPFTALDTDGVALVRALAEAHLADGGIVILTSHQVVALGSTLRKLSLS